MRIGRALEEVHAAELELAGEFRKVGQRHAADHDVYHLCHLLAEQCDAHAAALVPHGARYGQALDPPSGPGAVDSLLGVVRRTAAEAAGRVPESGLLLLEDLRRLYVLAQETSIDWTIVMQGAKAARDAQLLAAAESCLQETDVQAKWLKTRIKTAAPQVLTVG